ESYSRGESAYNAGDYDTATRLFTDALSQNSDNYSAHYYLGEIYLRNEDYNKAFNEFSSVLRLNPSFAPGHLGHGQANFGLGGNPLGDYDKARAANPQWAEPYIQSAIFYASRRNTDAAITELEAGRGLAPANVVVLWRLAEQYLAVGRYDDARAALDLGNEIDPSALDLYRVRAKLALSLEDYSDAQEALNTYTAYQPDDAEGWTLAGEAYLGLGDSATALTQLDRAVGLNPLDPREALIARGEAQLLLGNTDAARSDFDKALALGITTRFRVSIGRAYYRAGDYESAITELEKAVESDPTTFDPSYWLGAAQVGAKDFERAIRALTDAYSNAGSDQQSFDALYQRALAYNGAEQTENAAADLGAALALNVNKRAEQQTAAATLLRQLGGSPAPTHTPTAKP
ncbi:MAG: tetratricopeptide repeat protein, partial [Chloroflexota bacterium]